MNGVVALRVTEADIYSRHNKVRVCGIFVDWLPGGERGLATDLLTSTKPKDVGLILGPFTRIYLLRAAGGEEFHGSSMVPCAAEDNRAPNVEPDVCPG